MRRVAEGLGVESQSEVGRDAGGSRRRSDAAGSAAAAGKRPGVSSSTRVPGSPSEASGRRCPMARPGMERWRDRLALVTGASVGIGAAVARALVQQGLKVVGCARTVGNIEELAAECKSAGYPGTLIPYRCDLSNEEDILAMFSAIRSQHSGVDICINNAGLGRPDSLLSGSTSGWKEMLNVNVLALSICTREAYQSMKERNVDDGHIININSMSGHRVVPQSVTHFYSATKYAVTALTEGLRQELREAQTHIRATCLQPEDVTEAVIYVLSTPPHVQIGDIQMRPTEQVT
ncbi:dehydrogenase/reductase SDR family member 11 isoform X2 [Saimiri boliviensis]|uniref:dehydrogenase/reductase SDR family member 11 isoform X2 n=1 Tax=Saimiri boliviensis TaxID=27679 RepID=UPI00193EB34F|nr:dehydrogenase/reductase SDR family member 11 isoform X2 [Saimiri boliviensis boliviensis]